MTVDHYTGECLKELFRNVHSIEELIEQLINLSVQLNEISVNAAIASGHFDHQAKIFNEIAKQIEITSSFILNLSERSKELTSKISTQILSSLVCSDQREHFSTALNKTREPTNRSAIQHVSYRLREKISDQLYTASLSLSHLKPEYENLVQIVNRLFSISTSLRILANTADENEGLSFLSIAESIEKSSNEALNHGKVFCDFITRIQTSLTERCDCMRGELDAA